MVEEFKEARWFVTLCKNLGMEGVLGWCHMLPLHIFNPRVVKVVSEAWL